MVEYGNGVSQVAGRAGGGSGGTHPVGVTFSQVVDDAVHTVSTLPTPALAALILALIVVGLLVLRRAF